MKLFIKVIYGAVGTLILIFSLFILSEEFFSPEYYTEIVSGKSLTAEERSALNSKFLIESGEDIDLFYGYGKDLAEGGIILTNKRLINYLEDEGNDESQQMLFKDIVKIESTLSESIVDNDLIIVESETMTIVLSVLATEHNGKKLSARIKNGLQRSH